MENTTDPTDADLAAAIARGKRFTIRTDSSVWNIDPAARRAVRRNRYHYEAGHCCQLERFAGRVVARPGCRVAILDAAGEATVTTGTVRVIDGLHV